MKIVSAFFLTLFVFSMSSWLYVVGIQYFLGYNILTAPLTHYSRWPRVDDFGVLSFITAFISLFIFFITHTNEKFPKWI
ncbi:MAG: hypothetical protein AABX51_03235 [Nanoarchaeota archaeon]